MPEKCQFDDKRRFYVRLLSRVIIICIPILISYLVKPTVKLGEEFRVLITQPRIDPWATKNTNSQTNLDYFEIFK